MARYRATLAYDGTAYKGYQIQPGVPTIQGVLEQSLAEIFGKPTSVMAAGRTDSGVHATGQVIAFDAVWKHEEQALLQALNARLPEDIALQAIAQQAGFHPRFDALSRTYRYQVAVVHVRQPLLIKRAWQMQRIALDDTAMQAAATLIVGEHDFAAFGNPPQGENTVREVFRSVWQVEKQIANQILVYEIEATAFLHHMVRRLVGALVAVGRAQITVNDFAELLSSRDLSLAKWIAPPQGLTLVAVQYPPAGMSRDEYLRTQRYNGGG